MYMNGFKLIQWWSSHKHKVRDVTLSIYYYFLFFFSFTDCVIILQFTQRSEKMSLRGTYLNLIWIHLSVMNLLFLCKMVPLLSWDWSFNFTLNREVLCQDSFNRSLTDQSWSSSWCLIMMTEIVPQWRFTDICALQIATVVHNEHSGHFLVLVLI